MNAAVCLVKKASAPHIPLADDKRIDLLWTASTPNNKLIDIGRSKNISVEAVNPCIAGLELNTA
jgi:hypothetical protein